MTLLFWLPFAVVLYTYAGYPLIIAGLARVAPRPWKREQQNLSVSIVMAIHNCASLLPWKIEHLLSLEPSLVSQIIFVSDGSTDASVELLNAIDDPRAHVIALPDQAGKSSALNHGIAASTGDVILFVDIRPRIEDGAIAALVSNFADPSVGCVAGELVVRSSEAHDAAAATMGGLYWRYEQGIRNCEAAYDSPVGVYGGFYAIRRALATPMPAGLILDDMFQPLAIIRQGYRVVMDRTSVVTDTWPAKTANEFQRKVRTLSGNFQLVAQAPWVLSLRNRVLFQLVSHKLMRLVVPYFFVLMLVSSCVLAGHSSLWSAVAVAQAGFWLMALLALRVRIPVLHRIAAPASALLVLNAAAVVAMFRAFFHQGPLWKTWQPTSARAADLQHMAKGESV